MCPIAKRSPQEINKLTEAYSLSLISEGWTPPTTIGGTWTRVSPEGIYETWPKLKTSVDVVLSNASIALLGKSITAYT